MSFVKSLEELISTGNTLSEQAADVYKFLNSLPQNVIPDHLKNFLEECKANYKIIADNLEPWNYIKIDANSTEEELNMLFAQMNTDLAEKDSNQSFILRATACAWVSKNFMQILKLFKKLPPSGEKDTIRSIKLIAPVQRLPRLTLFSKEWLKIPNQTFEFTKILESINRKFLRLASALNQLVKIGDLEKQSLSILDHFFSKLPLVDISIIKTAVANSMQLSKINSNIGLNEGGNYNNADGQNIGINVDDYPQDLPPIFRDSMAGFQNILGNEELEQELIDDSFYQDLRNLPPVLQEFIDIWNEQIPKNIFDTATNKFIHPSHNKLFDSSSVNGLLENIDLYDDSFFDDYEMPPNPENTTGLSFYAKVLLTISGIILLGVIGAGLGLLLSYSFPLIIGTAIGITLGVGIGVFAGFSILGLFTLFTGDKFLGSALLIDGTTGIGAGVGAILGAFFPILGGPLVGAGIGAAVGFSVTAVPSFVTACYFKIEEWWKRPNFTYDESIFNEIDSSIEERCNSRGLNFTEIKINNPSPTVMKNGLVNTGITQIDVQPPSKHAYSYKQEIQAQNFQVNNSITANNPNK